MRKKYSHMLVDPTSSPIIETLKLAERPESLKEKVVAIFVNSKPNSLILMNLLRDRLRTEYHVKDVIWNDGENICRPSPIALINDVASLADLAITGTGD